jgi:crossover junction endodeoxyribonuclease RuvC
MAKQLTKRLQAKVDEAKKKTALKNQKEISGILAIDPATKLGWAVSNDMFGTFDFETRRDESTGMKWLRWKAKLNELLDLNNVKIVGFERPSGKNANGLISHSKFVAIIETVCEERGIEYVGFSAGTVKKFATGNGNAGKPLMIAAAKQKLGYPEHLNDDNECDALWILNLLKSDLSI